MSSLADILDRLSGFNVLKERIAQQDRIIEGMQRVLIDQQRELQAQQRELAEMRGMLRGMAAAPGAPPKQIKDKR